MSVKIMCELKKEQLEQKLSRRQQELVNQNIKKYDMLEENYVIGIDFCNNKAKYIMTTMEVKDGTFYVINCEEF